MKIAERTIHQASVIALFRRCLRATVAISDYSQRRTWRAYTISKFKQGSNERDPARIKAQLDDATNQVEFMEHLHRMKKMGATGGRGEAHSPLYRDVPHGSKTSQGASEIQSWLESLRIPSNLSSGYAQKLVSLGFDDVKALREDATAEDLHDAGILIGHSRRVLKEQLRTD